MPTYDVAANRLGLLVREHETRRRDGVSAATRSAAKTAAGILRAAAPRSSNALRDSIRVEYVGDAAEVVVDAPHAQAVEVGSRPHMPPIEPLIKWAERSGAADARDMAWGVATKIKFEGTRPTYFVRGSLHKIVEATGASVQQILSKGP